MLPSPQMPFAGPLCVEGNLDFSAARGKPRVAPIPGHAGAGVGAQEQEPQSQLLQGLRTRVGIWPLPAL